MNTIGFIALLLSHFICGRGLIQLFKLELRPLFAYALSMISGVAMASLLPFFLELAHIDITTGSVAGCLAGLTVLFAIPLAMGAKQWKMPSFAEIWQTATYPAALLLGACLGYLPVILKGMQVDADAETYLRLFAVIALLLSAIIVLIRLKAWKNGTINFDAVEIYEIPFFIAIGYLLFLSAWRCFYYPPIARDMTSGPEVMAKVALIEHHIINSLFAVDLDSTNNYLKPPFITSLQIIYKMFVQPIGQVWLSVFVVHFMLLISAILREKLHGVIVGLLMLMFLCMPEVFAYTYLMLFDYSNMIFLFLGVFFTHQYFEHKKGSYFAHAVFFYSIATYIRTETLILVVMVTPLILWHHFQSKQEWKSTAVRLAMLYVFPYIVYFLCMNIFVKYFIPIKYDVSSDVNKHLSDLSPFFLRLKEMSTVLLFPDFSKVAYNYYGYFPHFFTAILAVDICFMAIKRKIEPEAITALYGVVLVYVGLAFIGFLLPLADLTHTTKRGMFKIFPFMLL
ncbi:MAG: hypothetical protein EBX41_07845, partial [Chitinophagia bacterium]|nr:hypothetical protein [Chitinophagia bacterium]